MTEEQSGLEDRVQTLEREMSRLLTDRSIGSALDGKFTLKWPVRIKGPDGAAYILVREEGGNLALHAAEDVSKDDWVDA